MRKYNHLNKFIYTYLRKSINMGVIGLCSGFIMVSGCATDVPNRPVLEKTVTTNAKNDETPIRGNRGLLRLSLYSYRATSIL
jgi:hypothetical protein